MHACEVCVHMRVHVSYNRRAYNVNTKSHQILIDYRCVYVRVCHRVYVRTHVPVRVRECVSRKHNLHGTKSESSTGVSMCGICLCMCVRVSAVYTEPLKHLRKLITPGAYVPIFTVLCCVCARMHACVCVWRRR